MKNSCRDEYWPKFSLKSAPAATPPAAPRGRDIVWCGNCVTGEQRELRGAGPAGPAKPPKGRTAATTRAESSPFQPDRARFLRKWRQSGTLWYPLGRTLFYAAGLNIHLPRVCLFQVSTDGRTRRRRTFFAGVARKRKFASPKHDGKQLVIVSKTSA